MDREHLFRGRDITNGVWQYGYYLKTPHSDPKIITLDGGYVYVDPKTVGEWTGLWDCSEPKKRIFEDDIIQGLKSRHFVGFDDSEAKFYAELISSPEAQYLQSKGSITQEWINTFQKKVIGNIWTLNTQSWEYQYFAKKQGMATP